MAFSLSRRSYAQRTSPIGMSLLRTSCQIRFREYTIRPDQRNTHAAPYTELKTARWSLRAARGFIDDSCKDHPMLDLVKRVVRWAVALTLIVVGLVLSIPGIPGPGILVLLIGVFVLLPESRWLRKKYAALKRRYPWVFSPIETRRARARHDRRRSRSGS